jgi:hypothetical protein
MQPSRTKRGGGCGNISSLNACTRRFDISKNIPNSADFSFGFFAHCPPIMRHQGVVSICDRSPRHARISLLTFDQFQRKNVGWRGATASPPSDRATPRLKPSQPASVSRTPKRNRRLNQIVVLSCTRSVVPITDGVCYRANHMAHSIND